MRDFYKILNDLFVNSLVDLQDVQLENVCLVVRQTANVWQCPSQIAMNELLNVCAYVEKSDTCRCQDTQYHVAAVDWQCY